MTENIFLQVALGVVSSHFWNAALQQSSTLFGLFTSIILRVASLKPSSNPITFQYGAKSGVTIPQMSFSSGSLSTTGYKYS